MVRAGGERRPREGSSKVIRLILPTRNFRCIENSAATMKTATGNGAAWGCSQLGIAIT
jgi:hypothetical protein